MVEPGYRVAHVEDVPVLRMGEVGDVAEEFDQLGVRNLDEDALGTEEMWVKVWAVPPGARMGTHGHATQEEFYYVISGTFDVHIGPPGDTDTHRVGAGAVFAASPGIARGYENVGEEPGRVLVVAAPKVDEGGIPEGELIE